MIYLITALYDEAKPLLAYWTFKRDRSLSSYRLYRNETMYLFVTRMGLENASQAMQILMQHAPAKKGDILINVGLCAAPKTYPLGSALYAHSIQYREKMDILPEKNNITLPAISLRTVDSPASTPQNCAVDMEAYAIYQESKHLFHPDKIIFFKVVSDHFEPECINKQEAVDSIKKNIPKLELLITAMQGENYE